MRSLHGHIRAWGATAQGIYKLGDTVQYKIYVRDQENRRFIQPPAASYNLKVLDPASKVIFQRDNIKLSEFGAMDGEFLIPKNGAVGYYNFQLESSFAKLNLEPLQVLVSDFTPSPFRVTTDLNGKIFGTGESGYCLDSGQTPCRGALRRRGPGRDGVCGGPGFSAR